MNSEMWIRVFQCGNGHCSSRELLESANKEILAIPCDTCKAPARRTDLTPENIGDLIDLHAKTLEREYADHSKETFRSGRLNCEGLYMRLQSEIAGLIEAEQKFTANENPRADVQAHNERCRRFQQLVRELAQLAAQMGN